MPTAAHRHRRGHADALFPLLGPRGRIGAQLAGRLNRDVERANGPDGGGSLRVVTSNVRAGYLRKNGIPTASVATVTEHFDVAPLADNGRLLLVTTTVRGCLFTSRDPTS